MQDNNNLKKKIKEYAKLLKYCNMVGDINKAEFYKMEIDWILSRLESRRRNRLRNEKQRKR